MSIEITQYTVLKLSIKNLVDTYPIKYILKALGEVCISKGDEFVLKGMQSGNSDRWGKGETWCKIGKTILKLTG